jgi:hypothetical protein
MEVACTAALLLLMAGGAHQPAPASTPAPKPPTPDGRHRAPRVAVRQVVAVKVQAENDCAATCEDRNKCHVY